MLRKFVLTATCLLLIFSSNAVAAGLTVFGFEIGSNISDVRQQITKLGMEILYEKNIEEAGLYVLSTNGKGFNGYDIYHVDFVFSENSKTLLNMIVRQDEHTFDKTKSRLNAKYKLMSASNDGVYKSGEFAIVLQLNFDPQYQKKCVTVGYSTQDFLTKMAATDNSEY